MRHRSKHTLFGRQNTNNYSPTQKDETRTTSTFTLGKNSHLTKKNNKLHSKSTYFYRWGSRLNYVVPSACALALLIGGVVALNPDVNQVYADESSNNTSNSNGNNADAEVMPLADSSISLSFNGTPTLTEEVTAGEVAYITNTFTVNANKQTGFTLRLSAMNGSGTELRGKDNAMATIKGVGENVSPANFANNTWGYSYQENPNTALNPKTIAEGLTYSSMPAYGTEKPIANKTLTGVANENTTYLLAFAAKIGTDSPADHYIGNFLLSVVGSAFNPATYTLTYDGNGDNVTNIPAPDTYQETSVTTSHTFTISSTKPTRTGYTFLGWGNNSTDPSASYQPSTTITVQKSAPTKTLYAVWRQMFNGITTMQTMTSSICANAKEGDEAILEDARDHKKYYVTRLANGSCWMTQNLAYDGGGAEQCKLNGGEACSGWPEGDDDVARYAIGSYVEGNHNSQGNFYSWKAAMNNNTDASEPAQGICPPQWHLPTKAELEALPESYATPRTAPFYFTRSGSISGARLRGASDGGSYWSSTTANTYPNKSAYFIMSNYFSSTNPTIGYRDMHPGQNVRCIAN